MKYKQKIIELHTKIHDSLYEMWETILDQYIELLPDLNYEKEFEDLDKPMPQIIKLICQKKSFYLLNNLFWTLYPIHEHLVELKKEIQFFNEGKIRSTYNTKIGLSDNSTLHLITKLKKRFKGNKHED